MSTSKPVVELLGIAADHCVEAVEEINQLEAVTPKAMAHLLAAKAVMDAADFEAREAQS